MRAMIIDDEVQGISVMKKLLEYHCPEVEIVSTCNNPMEARSLVEKCKPDLVFLDISMPGKSGLKLLSEFEDIDFLVIFVTAHEQYILQALRLSAVDYLLKPVYEEELIKAVHKAQIQHQRSTKFENIKTLHYNQNALETDLKISIPSFNGFIIQKINDIVYCEADNNYTKIYLSNLTQHLVTKPLSYYDALLTEYHFVRIHKSFIVNVNHITGFNRLDGGSVTTSLGNTLDVSKRKKDFLLSELKKYMVGK